MRNKFLIFLLSIQTLTYSQVDGIDLCRSYKSKSFTYDKEANETLGQDFISNWSFEKVCFAAL